MKGNHFIEDREGHKDPIKIFFLTLCSLCLCGENFSVLSRTPLRDLRSEIGLLAFFEGTEGDFTTETQSAQSSEGRMEMDSECGEPSLSANLKG